MYVQQSIGSLALQDAKQLVNFAANRAEYSAELLREKANSDLFYAQAELEKDGQDFMRSLQQRSDYDNFSSLADDFLNKKKDVLTKNAQNAYTAKLYDKMLTSYRNNLMNNIENQKLKMYVDDMNAQDAATVKKNSEIYSGQALINQNIKVITTQYADGRISAQEQLTKTINASTEAIYSDKVNGAKADIKSFIASGKSLDDFMKAYDETYGNKKYKVKVLDAQFANQEGLQEALMSGIGFSDISESIDYKELNTKAKKALETEWKKEQEKFQNGNFSSAQQRLQERFNETTDKEVREDIKASEYRIFKNTIKQNPYFYSEPQKYQLMHLYEPDELSEERKARLKAAKGYDEKQFKADLSDLADGLIAGVQNGTASREYGVKDGYAAYDYYKNYFFDYGKSAGLSDDELLMKWGAECASFNDKLAKAYKGNKSLQGVITKYNQFLKGLDPKNPCTTQLIAEAEERLFDGFYATDVSIQEETESLIKRLENDISNCAIQKYSILKTAKNDESLFMQEHLNKDGTVKDEGNLIHDAFIVIGRGGKKITFTDRRDQVHMNENARKSVELADSVVVNWMVDVFGVKPEDIQPEWELNERGDETTECRIYRMGNEVYTFQVTEKFGKDKTEFINAKTGDVIADVDKAEKMRKEHEKSLTKEQRKQEAEERKRLQTEKNEAIKRNAENRKVDDEKLTERALLDKKEIMQKENIPEEYLLTWDTMGVEERKMQLQAWDKTKNKQ